jgi:preprotein translocase subunit SecE
MSTDKPANSGSPAAPISRSRGGIKGFSQDIKREIKQITWPTRRETTRLTGVVLALCLGITCFLYVVSKGFEILLHQIVQGGP